MPTVKIIVQVWDDKVPRDGRQLRYCINDTTVNLVANPLKNLLERLSQTPPKPTATKDA